jgi:hypothetical protein
MMGYKTISHKPPSGCDLIFELENQLSQHNSHTSSLGKFQEYLATQCRVEQELYAHYCDKNHRIARWHNWRDR